MANQGALKHFGIFGDFCEACLSETSSAAAENTKVLDPSHDFAALLGAELQRKKPTEQ